MKQRWYDFDPIMALAVKTLEDAGEKDQKYLLEYIISKARALGITLKDDINAPYDCCWHRRTDKKALFIEAMKYFKELEVEIQKELGIFIIRYAKKELPKV